jgi:hypothetical protein
MRVLVDLREWERSNDSEGVFRFALVGVCLTGYSLLQA